MRTEKEKAKFREYGKRYRLKHKLKLKLKREKDRDRLRYDGKRKEILEKYGNQCSVCGFTNEESLKKYKKGLSIHHKDGHGRTSGINNNELNNLELLCLGCHMQRHNPIQFSEQEKRKHGG